MSTTPIGSYKFFQKLHPLSLLAQLTSRRATGCLRVFNGTTFWSLYLEEGKLTYASYSDKLFERLDAHLKRASVQIPTLNSATRVQVRLLFETNTENQSISNTDYQAICWLVNQNYINANQAAILIEELAKEVLQSFLVLKEGSYEFNPDNTLVDLPKFCHLDLRLLVENCQRQLRNQKIMTTTRPTAEVSVAPAAVSSQSAMETETISEVGQSVTKITNLDDVDNNSSNNKIATPSTHKKLYTVACIDDSPTVLNSIRRFLDENTFSVVMINDPVKALMQILRAKPDIILLDVEMPNLDGYELCSLLRRHQAFKDTPIIMVTGRTGFIDRAKAKMVRSSGYLTKPFTQADLLKMVFKHIS